MGGPRGGARRGGEAGRGRAGLQERGGLGGGGCCERSWSRCLRRRRPGLSPSRTAACCGLVMATNQRPFHLVVVGASGFTGQFVTEEVAREQLVPDRGPRLPWAVAGRSREKLQRVLERAALKLGKGAEESRLRCAPQIQEPRPLPQIREGSRQSSVCGVSARPGPVCTKSGARVSRGGCPAPRVWSWEGTPESRADKLRGARLFVSGNAC